MTRLGYRQRLVIGYLTVVFSSLLLVSVYLNRTIQGHFLSGLDNELKTYTLLASEIVRDELVGRRDTAAIDAIADDLGRRTGIRVTVIGADGVVLGDSERDPAAMENHGSRPEVLEALKAGIGATTRYSTTLGARLRYIAMPVSSNGAVVGYVRLAMPLAQVERSAGVIGRFITNAAILATLVGLVLSLVLARSIGNPLRDMASAARQIARGDFGRKIPVRGAGGGDELGQLAEAFNYMAGELERSISEISERKNRMETILSAMADSVVAVDRSGRILLMNRAACSMFGISEAQVRGKYVLEAIRNHDLAESLDLASAGQADTRELRLQTPRPSHLRLHTAPILDRDGISGAVAVLQDVTDLRRLEQVRTDFVSNVSHELRTPVTSIKGFVDTLLDGAMEDRETLHRFLEVISREADRLAQIISDLLELSRLESRGSEIRKSPVALRSVVNAALGIVQDRAKARNIRIDVEIEPDFPRVPGDEDLLVQVFVNLLDNAVKYTQEGGNVKVSASRDDGTTRVDVSDTGIGIAPEHLPRVFERFYRIDRARSRQLGGTGLGLSIVKHIVERHGGTVSVSSTPGKGSTFSFTLPG
ncbi:MAG: two-component system histidine kinase PnpS [Bacillota bacterium]